jgi:hypothetical protein
MGNIKAIKLESTVNAYVQLPVGVHTIGDKKYTVSEKIENEGLENEWRTTVIDLIEPVGGEPIVE